MDLALFFSGYSEAVLVQVNIRSMFLSEEQCCIQRDSFNNYKQDIGAGEWEGISYSR